MKTRLSNPYLALLICPVLLANTASLAFAASATWNGTTDAAWATTTNWSAAPVPGTGDTATFNNAGGASDVISLGSGVTIKTIAFSGTPDAYTIGSGAVGSQTLTMNDAATITLANTITADQLINARVVLGNGLVITNSNASNTLTIAGVISGTGTLGKAGTGNVILSGNNTFTGTTTLTAGTLTLNNNLALQSSLLSTASTGVISLGAGITAPTLGGLTGSRVLDAVITTGYAGITDLALNNQGAAISTYSGNIATSAMNLVKSGSGTQILSGTNSYTGNTTVNAGVLTGTTTAALPGYNSPGKVSITGGTLAVQVGGTGWTTGEVDTLLTNATKTSGALGIDTTNGNLDQWADFTTANFGSLGLIKLGANTLTLDQTATYTGTTTLGGGTLAFTASATLAGGLTFGSAAASTTASSLDLSTASATFGGLMLVQTSTNTNTITIGSGQKLTVNNNVNFGTALNQVASSLTVSGAGGWDVVSSNGIFAGTGTNSSSGGAPTMTVDMSGLAEFSANLRTGGSGSAGGTFRVGQAGDNGTNTRTNSVSLATKSTISADVVELRGNSVGTNTLLLGDAEQIINSDTIRMGLHTGRAETSSITFRTTTGTIQIRGTDGGATSRSNLSMITGATGTGAAYNNTFNVTGHDADLLFDVVNVYNSTANTGDTTLAYNATFSFDFGDLDINTFRIGNKGTGSLNNTANATANIGSVSNLSNTASLGTVTMGAHTTATGGTANGILNSTLNVTGASTTVNFNTLSMANSTTNDADTEVVSAVNISGGTVTATGGINMLDAHTAGTATSTLTVSGGSLSVGTSGVSATNGIYRGAATGTTTLRLNGGSLDLNGNAIGGANAITTQFESGTLTDVGQINGGAGLTKTTAGTLTLVGTNSYTGTTAVNGGTLSMSSPSLADASAVTIATGAVLNLSYIGTDTVDSLSVGGGSPLANGTYDKDSPETTGFITGDGKLQVGVATTPYDTWVALYQPGFTNNLPGQDQDDDGLTNQEEFAFGLNPKSGSSVNPITAGLATGTGNFSYTRNATSGLNYKIWSSTDLAVWTLSITAVKTPVGIPDSFGTQTVDVTNLGATPVDGKLFVRVTAE